VAKVINDALLLGGDSDYGYDYVKDFEERFQIKSRNPITTGWSQIDLLCRNGLGRGELGVVIAPTGAGKSMVLVHLGTEALKLGKTVVHYTLELADLSIASRYDSCLTSIDLGDLILMKDKVLEAVKEVKGTLVVKEYPTKSASTRTIKAHLEKLRQRGLEIGMVIVDYGDLLKPVIMTGEKRHDLESIYEELRAIAQEYKCPVWTASQTNRSGLNAEVITMESISEAFSKCFVADFIFSVSRTIEDKSSKGGRIFVAKNRNGPDGLIYPIFMDPSNVAIEVLEPTGETASEVIANSIKDQATALRDKYKEFKKGKGGRE
jgi:replicative DNA helicase